MKGNTLLFSYFSMLIYVLIYQIAQHKGYIKINWNRLNSEMETARREIERRAKRNYGGVIQNVGTFII